MSTHESSTSPLILLTGSTGYLGFVVLVQALKAGYRVRAAVRNIEAAQEKILRTASLKSGIARNLTFIEVRDILEPGAYHEAVKEVDYIIHVASPLPGPNIKDFEEELVKPAVQGTLGILEEAYHQPQIKRIVITSSIAANTDLSNRQTVINEETRVPTPKGPLPAIFPAYIASKISALNATEEFIRERKPTWDVVSIQPGFIMGSNELARTPEAFLTGTAANPVRAYISEGQPIPTAAIHVEDAAYFHVAALDTRIKGNRSYGATYTVDWNSAWTTLEARFGSEIKQGIFNKTEVQNVPVEWDASESVKVFDHTLRSFESTVVELADDWLALKQAKPSG